MASARSMRSGRALRRVLVALLGLVVGVALYFAYGWLTAPRPHDTPFWSLAAEMPAARGETAVAVAGDRLFVIGGLTGAGFESTAEVSIFDGVTGTWAAGPPLPEPRHHAAAAAFQGDVYVTGGSSSIADGTPRPEAWVLRAGAATWETIAPMPVGRMGHRLVALGGNLYVVGGVPGAGEFSPTTAVVLVYTPLTEAWTSGGAIPQTRDHLAAVAVGGEIWAIGGRAGGRNVARVDIYDPITKLWRDGPPLPEATSGAAEAFVAAKILVSGGEDPGTGQIVDRHWQLDTVLDGSAWEELPPPPLTVHGAPGAAVGDRFIIAGGAARAGGQSNTAWSALTQVRVVQPTGKL